MADLADRSLDIGDTDGSALLMTLLMASLAIWYRSMGTVAISSIHTPRAEMFYWLMIMFSQTLGTALGDWAADTADLGYSGGALIFSVLLGLVAAAYYWTSISKTILLWAAFILT